MALYLYITMGCHNKDQKLRLRDSAHCLYIQGWVWSLEHDKV
jgi:hypothetical protein